MATKQGSNRRRSTGVTTIEYYSQPDAAAHRSCPPFSSSFLSVAGAPVSCLPPPASDREGIGMASHHSEPLDPAADADAPSGAALASAFPLSLFILLVARLSQCCSARGVNRRGSGRCDPDARCSVSL